MKFFYKSPAIYSNIRKLLMTLDLAMPILIEGPPGIGKTKTVEFMARVYQKELVRINFSEETEIADLIGSERPFFDDTAKTIKFEWIDGILLKAIKAKSWILLDELNLAQQAVIEGLNSLFDHRKSIFVPELNQTFTIDSSESRIFACQNPSIVTSGRKTMPRSFLNRFITVILNGVEFCLLRVCYKNYQI